MGTPQTTAAVAALINRYPDRFLFGSDVVAPTSIESPLAVYHAYDGLWSALTPEASRKVRLGNYQRLFDAARARVRAWEKVNAGRPPVRVTPSPPAGYSVDTLTFAYNRMSVPRENSVPFCPAE